MFLIFIVQALIEENNCAELQEMISQGVRKGLHVIFMTNCDDQAGCFHVIFMNKCEELQEEIIQGVTSPNHG